MYFNLLVVGWLAVCPLEIPFQYYLKTWFHSKIILWFHSRHWILGLCSSQLNKGGQKSKKKLKNYRPIALMDTIGKIFCMVLNERIRKCFDMKGVLSEEQNGFRMGRWGEVNMFIVRELMEKCKRENKRGYYAFLDIEKAYDNQKAKCIKRCLRLLVNL